MDVNFEMADKSHRSDMYKIYKNALERSEDYSEKREDALLFSRDEMPEKLYVDDGNITIIAKRDGRVVGWSSLMVDKSALDGLFVDPVYQGYGIGSSMLSRIESLATSESLSQMILMTNPDTEDFYLEKGYNRVGDGMVLGLYSDDEIFCVVLMKQLV